MVTLIYAMRSVVVPSDLQNDVLVLQRLRSDMAALCREVTERRPDWVIGLGNGKVTQFETVAENVFHGSKQVSQGGKPVFVLHIPATMLPVSPVATDSFCNWSAYSLAAYIEAQGLGIPLSFLHVAKVDPEPAWQELRRILSRGTEA